MYKCVYVCLPICVCVLQCVYSVDEICRDDGNTLGPDAVYNYLGRIMYQRRYIYTHTNTYIHKYTHTYTYTYVRSKMDPLWNAVVVGGLKENKP